MRPKILDVYNPYLGDDAAKFPYKPAPMEDEIDIARRAVEQVMWTYVHILIVRNRYLAANDRVLPFRTLIRIGCGPQAGATRCHCNSTSVIERASRRSASKPCPIDYRWPNHHRCTVVSLAIQEHRPICRC